MRPSRQSTTVQWSHWARVLPGGAVLTFPAERRGRRTSAGSLSRARRLGGGNMRRKQVLITGGAGFIGSHLADELIAQGYRVRALDALLPQVHGEGRSRPPY